MPCGSLERVFDPGLIRATRGNTRLVGAHVATARIAPRGTAPFNPAGSLYLSDMFLGDFLSNSESSSLAAAGGFTAPSRMIWAALSSLP